MVIPVIIILGRHVSFHLDENNIVILSGQVQLPSLKVSAQRAAMNIEGVRGVINQLEVLSASSWDDDIAVRQISRSTRAASSATTVSRLFPRFTTS